jgi:solute carrier family 6 amino acid transporter-like protein 5/7/9/14
MVLESRDTAWTKTKKKEVICSVAQDTHPSSAHLVKAQACLAQDDSLKEIPDDDFSENSSVDENRGSWDNPIEFLLSCLGFAVGLGNIWRFPYLCYRNGGGAFLIPYIVSLIFMGLPVFLFEMGAGQFSNEGPIAVWKMCPLFQGIGYGMCFLSLYIGTYYNIILSWAFFYVFSSFTSSLPWASCGNPWNTEACRRFDSKNCTELGGVMTNQQDCIFQKDVTVDVWRNISETARNAKMPSDEFFHNFMLDISNGIHDIGEVRLELAGCLLLAWVLVYCALWKGIKSFGKLVYFTALFPYCILIILLVRAATLPGYMDGISFYLTPKWEKLLEINVWADACIQIFFSLGVTWGGMITLASYNKFKNNVFRDAIMVGCGNCMTSFFAGFVIFGIIGFMAHELGVPVEEVAAQGAGLAFIAYPEAVSRMPISPLWSILFFMMLLSLGFGTQFSTVETVVTVLLDRFPNLRGKNRRWCTLGVCLFMFCCGLSMVTNGGIYILQLVDNHSATYSALILGCLEVSVMAWIYGVDKFLEDLRFMLGFYPYPRLFWKWSWKISSPVIVILILNFTIKDYQGNKYDDYHYPDWANTVGWCITFSSVVCIPIVGLFKIARAEGSLWARISQLTTVSPDWGPKMPPTAGPEEGALLGMPARVEGSAMTLIPNSSTTDVADEQMNGAAQATLEPLKERFEEEEDQSNSEDEGLNMKEIQKIQMEVNIESSCKK